MWRHPPQPGLAEALDTEGLGQQVGHRPPEAPGPLRGSTPRAGPTGQWRQPESSLPQEPEHSSVLLPKGVQQERLQDQGPLWPQWCNLYGRPSHVQTSRSEGPLHHGPDLQTILTRAARSENKQLFPALVRLQVRSQMSTSPTKSRPAGQDGVPSSTTWTVRRDEERDRRAEQ